MPSRIPRCRVTRAGGGRGGFVLVTTLVLMLLAAMLLAGLARQSLSIAAAADDAQQQLQRRWGAFSLRMAVLTHPQEILAAYQRARARRRKRSDSYIHSRLLSAWAGSISILRSTTSVENST